MKQTAVEFLLSHMWTTDWVNYTREEKLKIIEQAKEMEEQQRKDDYLAGLNAKEAKERAKNYMRLKGALEPKQETIEKAAQRLQKDKYGIFISKDADVKGQLVIDTANAAFLSGMNEGAKWQQEKMYSEEDMISFAHFYFREEFNSTMQTSKSTDEIFKEWFEQFKKK